MMQARKMSNKNGKQRHWKEYMVKTISKNGRKKTTQKCSKLFKIAQTCSKLLKNDQKCAKPGKKNCSKMLKIAQNCSKLLKIAQNCSKLLKIAQKEGEMSQNKKTCSKLLEIRKLERVMTKQCKLLHCVWSPPWHVKAYIWTYNLSDIYIYINILATYLWQQWMKQLGEKEQAPKQQQQQQWNNWDSHEHVFLAKGITLMNYTTLFLVECGHWPKSDLASTNCSPMLPKCTHSLHQLTRFKFQVTAVAHWWLALHGVNICFLLTIPHGFC